MLYQGLQITCFEIVWFGGGIGVQYLMKRCYIQINDTT